MKRISSIAFAILTALTVLAAPALAAPAGTVSGFSMAAPVARGFAFQEPTTYTSLRIHDGASSPDVTVGTSDAYIEGTFEVDGAARFDGAADFNSTIDMSAGLATLHSFRVGTGSTPDVTLGADDGFIEGTLEVDGATRLDGTTTAQAVNGTTLAGSTSVTAGTGGNTWVFSTTGGVAAGTARPTYEIFVPAGEFLANAGSPANGLIGSANAQGWALDATSDESISAMFKVPDGFAAADNTCYIGWSTTGTTDTQAVYFDVVTVPTAPGEDSGLAGNTDSVNDALDGSAIADELHETSVTVASSTEWAADDIVYLTIVRDADNGSDDLAADVSVQYFRCTGTATDVQ